MADKEKKDNNSLDISRRDFLRLAGTGVLAGAVAAMPKTGILGGRKNWSPGSRLSPP